jgi:hypothetical protein
MAAAAAVFSASALLATIALSRYEMETGEA